MNFTPLTEEDLKSEKAKQIVDIYRFIDCVFDETKKESKISYKDSIEINNAINESFKEFKEILLKNLLGSVSCFKGKENELSAFITIILDKIGNNQSLPDYDSFFASYCMFVRNNLYFTKSENEIKYDGMFFGRIVNDYETGKLTIDEINDRCWKYAKMIQEQNHNWNNFGNNIFNNRNGY